MQRRWCDMTRFIELLCNPDRSTLNTEHDHNHKMDGARSGAEQTESTAQPARNSNGFSQTMFCQPSLDCAAHNRSEAPPRARHCQKLNGAARSEKLRNKVLKTFGFNNRMKMEKETKYRTPVSFWNFLIIFKLQDHMEFSFGYLKTKPKNSETPEN